MAKRIIALRESPDWFAITDDDTRHFLKRHGLPENLLVNFITLWDRTMKMDYRTFRHEVAALSRANYAAVTDAQVVSHKQLRAHRPADDALIIFVDDDDWLAPSLFEELKRACPRPKNGVYWGSIFVGPQFTSFKASQQAPILRLRPLDRMIYTNNYAVAGRALNRMGYARLFEHYRAQQTFAKFWWPPKAVPKYLSAVSKHPCSTLTAKFLMEQPEFRADPRRTVRRFAEQLAQATPSQGYDWLRAPMTKLAGLVGQALGEEAVAVPASEPPVRLGG